MKRAPQLGALIFSVAAAVCAAVQLDDVPPGGGGSTAQAVAMGAGVIMILFGAIAGWICGASARSLALAGKPRHARSVVYLATLLLTLFCGMFWLGHRRVMGDERLRTGALTPEQRKP